MEVKDGGNEDDEQCSLRGHQSQSSPPSEVDEHNGEDGGIRSPSIDGNISPVSDHQSYNEGQHPYQSSKGEAYTGNTTPSRSNPDSPYNVLPYSPVDSHYLDGPASPDELATPVSPPNCRPSHSPDRSPTDRKSRSHAYNKSYSPPGSPEHKVFQSPYKSPSLSPLPATQTSPMGSGPASPDEICDQNDSFLKSNSQSNSTPASPTPENLHFHDSLMNNISQSVNQTDCSQGGSPIESFILQTQTSPTGAGADSTSRSPILETQTFRTDDDESQSIERHSGVSPERTPMSTGSQDRDSLVMESIETQPMSPGGEPTERLLSPERPTLSPARESPERSPASPPISPLSKFEGNDTTIRNKDIDDLDLLEIHAASKGRGSDDESDKESAVGELIADIFGSSDDEEEFEGFGEADVETVAKLDKKKVGPVSEGGGERDEEEEEEEEEEILPVGDILPDISDDEVDDDLRAPRADFVSDFDQMMAKKKEENQRRRRRKRDEENITENDDLIDEMIKQMKSAAEQDRILNENKKAATNKLKYLPHVTNQLKKADLHGSFIDCGILNAMTEWLAPLPDRSLPHLKIREVLLKALLEFPSISSETLKTCGVGKAVMYMYKHPKETRENRDMAGKLINEWSRPIFNLTSNFKLLSKEEREQRDYEQLPKKRRISTEGGETPRQDIDHALAGDERALRPGDPGWIMRARVPVPSNKDYVVRPKWNIEEVNQRAAMKKKVSRYDKHKRAFADKKKKAQNILTMSIEGRNMTL